MPASPLKNLSLQPIAETLAERIGQGVYALGSPLPAERELAAEFSRDRSAVRAALSELTRRGLISRNPGCRPRVSATGGRAADARPAEHAPRRREGSGLRAIAVILPQHEADHGSREIVRGITHTLRSQEAPYRPLIFDTNLRTAPRTALEQEACDAIMQEGITGAIVWPTLEPGSLDGWRMVQAQGHPVVFVDRCDPALPGDFVGVDNYAAAKEATEFLLTLGHTRIAHLTYEQKISSVQERISGYRDALHAAGIVLPSETICALPPGASSQCVEAFVSWLLETKTPPTAIFTVNDQIAHFLIARLEACGKRIPADFSVLGFDDDDMHSARPALLTTVRQPFERIGQRAAELLLRRLGPPPVPALPHTVYQHVLLPTRLVERSTCRPLF